MLRLGALLLLAPTAAVALEDGAFLTPPRGWSSWYSFEASVSQEKMLQNARILSSYRGPGGTGPTLVELNYSFVSLDDAWQACGKGTNKSFHDAAGRPLFNQKKFPDVVSMNKQIHAMPGAGGQPLQSMWYLNNWMCSERTILPSGFSLLGDANATVALGFDGVKLDSGGPNGNIFAWEKALSAAAKAANRSRPLFINNCHNSVQGTDPSNDSAVTHRPNTDQVPYLHEDERNFTGDQLLVCPMHSWRISHDNNPDFHDVMAVIQSVLPFGSLMAPIARPGCWPDPDMLQIHGMQHDLAGARSHVSVWAIASAPMVISFDLTNEELRSAMWPLISNRRVLDVNAAWAGHPGTLLAQSRNLPSNGSAVSNNPHLKHLVLRTQWQFWAKPLPGGSVAVLGINFDGFLSLEVSFALAQIPPLWWAKDEAPTKVRAVDAWTGDELPSVLDGARLTTQTLAPHACQMLILTAA